MNPKLLALFEESWRALAKVRSDARWRLQATASDTARAKYTAMADGIGMVQRELAQRILSIEIHSVKRKLRWTHHWPVGVFEKLGTTTDEQLGKVFNVSKSKIQRERVRRGIPSFHSQVRERQKGGDR